MNHLKCEIVKDLIPSYLDGICSNTSRDAVKTHLADCESCRTFLERMRDTMLTADAINLKSLDYMKKVKRHYLRKNRAAAGICLIFSLLLMALPNASWFPPNLHYGWYYTLFPLLMLSASPLLSVSAPKPSQSRLQKGAAIAGCLGILYCLGLECFFLLCAGSKSALFSRSPETLGLFLDSQRKAILLLELAFFLLLIFSAAKNEYATGLLPLLNLTGCFLCLIFGIVLHQLDTPKAAARTLLGQTACILLEGLALAGILLLCRKIPPRFRNPWDCSEP